MFVTVYVLSFVAGAIWPSEGAIAMKFATLPIALVGVFVGIEHATLSLRQEGLGIDLSFVIFLILVVNGSICLWIVVEGNCKFFLAILGIKDLELPLFRPAVLYESIELK